MKEIDNFLYKSTKVLNEIDKKIILKSLKILKKCQISNGRIFFAGSGGGAGVGGTWAVGTAGIHTTKNVGVNTTAVKGTAVGAATSEGAVQAHGSVSVFDGFIMTDKQIDKHLTLPSDKNAILIGPVTIATGIGITIESGATLLIA